jgi:hypothetical protein
VEDMGVQTVHAEQLLKAAKIVYRIRSAMVGAQRWPTARPLCPVRHYCVTSLCHYHTVSLCHCVTYVTVHGSGLTRTRSHPQSVAVSVQFNTK